MVAVLLVTGLATTGCVEAFRPIQHDRERSIGHTVAAVQTTGVEEPRGVVVYDLSYPVLGKQASFDLRHGEEFTVLVDCSDPAGDPLILGVIPAAEATPQLLARARAGGFNDLLFECDAGGWSAAHIGGTAGTLSH